MRENTVCQTASDAAGEAARYYEESMELVRELQRITLGMLKDIDRVCAEYGIPYYLGEGTLLGAVRHKGFIPWDDDIDLLMMREDYERFLTIAPQAMGENYEIQHYTTMENCWTPLLKVRLLTDDPRFRQSHIAHVTPNNGPMIDIFPLDNVPEPSSFGQTVQGTMARILRGTLSQKMKTADADTAAKKVLRLASHFVSRDFLFRCINRNYLRYNSPDNAYVVCLASYYKVQKETFPKEAFGEPVRVPFEDGMFPVPQDPDLILTTIYGDYMTPPPPEKRVIKHHF